MSFIKATDVRTQAKFHVGHVIVPGRYWKIVQAIGRWGRLVFQVFPFVKRDCPAVLLIAAVVTVLGEKITQLRFFIMIPRHCRISSQH